MNSEKTDSAFVERLKVLLAGAKPYPWAANVGITQATFNRMWKDGIAPKADILLLISEKTGCSIDWLLTGKGEMRLESVTYELAEGLKNGDVTGEQHQGQSINHPKPDLTWFHDWVDEELQGKSMSEIMAVAVKIKAVLDESKEG